MTITTFIQLPQGAASAALQESHAFWIQGVFVKETFKKAGATYAPLGGPN
jgi:hypothetical protein